MHVECTSVHGKVKGADTCILEVLGLLIAMLKLALGINEIAHLGLLLCLANFFCFIYTYNYTWVASPKW